MQFTTKSTLKIPAQRPQIGALLMRFVLNFVSITLTCISFLYS